MPTPDKRCSTEQECLWAALTAIAHELGQRPDTSQWFRDTWGYIVEDLHRITGFTPPAEEEKP